jgi:hypothetical protein
MAPLGPLSGPQNLSSYLQGVFQVGIGIAGILAVVMIVMCGVKLIGDPSVSQRSEAKKCITNSIFGLLLASGSWIILNTVNSQLISSQLTLGNITMLPTIGSPTTSGDDPMPTSPGWYYRYKGADGKIKNSSGSGYSTSEECLTIMNQRKKNGDTIQVVGGVECFQIRAIEMSGTEKETRKKICGNESCVITSPIGIKQAACANKTMNGVLAGCINVEGFTSPMIDTIKQLQSSCGCDVVITGGTEGGHLSHAPGNRVFDVRRSTQLDAFIKNNASGPPKPSFGGFTRWQYNGYWYTLEITSKANWWHVCANGDSQFYCN